MKKVILFATVVSAFSLASCKKEHDCTCSTTYSFAGNTSAATTTITTYKDVKKKQAKTLCVSYTTTDEDGGVTTATCKVE